MASYLCKLSFEVVDCDKKQVSEKEDKCPIGVSSWFEMLYEARIPWTTLPSRKLEKTSNKKNMEQNNICPDNESMPERCPQKANQNGILLQNELKVIKKMVTGLNQNGKTQKWDKA